MSCNRFDSSMEDAVSGYSSISDTIRSQLVQVYNQDTAKQKPPLLTWLNLNGGYILAFKYIDDSLQHHPDNELALQGADIAYQHSYMEKSLAFSSHFKRQKEKDSASVISRLSRIYRKALISMMRNSINHKPT